MLGWTAIFLVKFAYLCFFRRLVNRVRKLTIFWYVITSVTMILWPACVISVWADCPHKGLAESKFQGTYHALIY